MAKQKNTKLPAPAPIVINEADEYGVGEWAGSPHYKCRLCLFDTLSGLDVMLTHLVERHSSETALNALFPNAPDPLSGDGPVNGAEIKEVEDVTSNIN